VVEAEDDEGPMTDGACVDLCDRTIPYDIVPCAYNYLVVQW